MHAAESGTLIHPYFVFLRVSSTGTSPPSSSKRAPPRRRACAKSPSASTCWAPAHSQRRPMR